MVVWHGYEYAPKPGNTNANGIWFRMKIVDNTITTTGFKVQVEVLTDSPIITFYGGYLLVSMTDANLPFAGVQAGFSEM